MAKNMFKITYITFNGNSLTFAPELFLTRLFTSRAGRVATDSRGNYEAITENNNNNTETAHPYETATAHPLTITTPKPRTRIKPQLRLATGLVWPMTLETTV